MTEFSKLWNRPRQGAVCPSALPQLLLALTLGLLLAGCAPVAPAGSGSGSSNSAAAGPSATSTSKAGVPSAASLVNTTWQLQGAAGAISTDLQRNPTLRFDDANRLSGSGGCNRFGGAWRLDSSGQFTVGPLMATKMACAQVVMQQEASFLSALQRAQRLSLDGAVLLIHGADNEKPLRLTRMGS